MEGRTEEQKGSAKHGRETIPGGRGRKQKIYPRKGRTDNTNPSEKRGDSAGGRGEGLSDGKGKGKSKR